MSAIKTSKRAELEGKLEAVDLNLRSQMRARGFDPDQDDNVALTAPLARLYTERENLRNELNALVAGDDALTQASKSMSEIERITDQLKRAFEGEAWHGPAVLEILNDVTSQQAAARPLNSVHSIWELALHIAAWERAGVLRLQGERAQLSGEEDWPPIRETSEEAWEQTKRALKQGHDEFVQAISRLDDSRLDEPIVPGLSSAYSTLHGIIQHDLYHAGQIALLKKMVTENEQV